MPPKKLKQVVNIHKNKYCKQKFSCTHHSHSYFSFKNPASPAPRLLRSSWKVEPLGTACQQQGCIHLGRNQFTLSRNIKIIIWLITKASPDSRGSGRCPEGCIGSECRAGRRAGRRLGSACLLTGGGGHGRQAA